VEYVKVSLARTKPPDCTSEKSALFASDEGKRGIDDGPRTAGGTVDLKHPPI
jgi:hypothetical protein